MRIIERNRGLTGNKVSVANIVKIEIVNREILGSKKKEAFFASEYLGIVNSKIVNSEKLRELSEVTPVVIPLKIHEARVDLI